MKLPDKSNAILTAIGVLAGAGGIGGAIDAKMDAGDNSALIAQSNLDMKEWNKAASLRIAELEKTVADLKGYIRGVETGEKSCKP